MMRRTFRAFVVVLFLGGSAALAATASSPFLSSAAIHVDQAGFSAESDPTSGRTDITQEVRAPQALSPHPRRDAIAGVVQGILAITAALTLWYIWVNQMYRPVPVIEAEAGLTRMPDWPMLLIAALLVWFAQQLGAASAAMLMSLTPEMLLTLRGSALMSMGSYIGAALGALFVFFLLPNLRLLIGMSFKPSTIGEGLWRGILGMLLVFPAVMTVGWLASVASWMVSGRRPDEVAHTVLRQLVEPGAMFGTQSIWWCLMVLCVTIGAPIAEELVYRGLLQSSLRRALQQSRSESATHPANASAQPRHAWPAILVTSVIFALIHAGVAEWHALATLMVLSICFGVAYERTRNLMVPIVMHVIFNVANIVLAMMPNFLAVMGSHP